MGEDDRAGPRRDRFLETADIDVVRPEIDIEKHRHEPVLDRRVDGRREPGGDGDDFVAGLELTVAKLPGGQRARREKIRRGAGVAEDRVADAHRARELALEL